MNLQVNSHTIECWSRVDRTASQNWAEQIRQDIYANVNVTDLIESGVANRSRARNLKALKIKPEAYPTQAHHVQIQTNLDECARLLRGIFPTAIGEILARIPVVAFPSMADVSTGCRRSDDGCRAFIGIDVGLLAVLTGITSITTDTIFASFDGEDDMSEAARKVLWRCQGYLEGVRIPDFSEWSQPDPVRMFLASLLAEMQFMFLIAHEYAHIVLGHFEREEENYPRHVHVPKLDLGVFNAADFLNATRKQEQEVEADATALEMCIEASLTSPLAKVDQMQMWPVGIPALFANLTLTNWVGVHYVYRDRDEQFKVEFLKRMALGQHPNPTMRLLDCQEKALSHASEIGKQFFGSYTAILSGMLKALEKAHGGRTNLPNWEAEEVQIRDKLGDYLFSETNAAANDDQSGEVESTDKLSDEVAVAAMKDVLLRDVIRYMQGSGDIHTGGRVRLMAQIVGVDEHQWMTVLLEIKDGEKELATLIDGADDKLAGMIPSLLTLTDTEDPLAPPEQGSPLEIMLSRSDPLLHSIARAAAGTESNEGWRRTTAALNVLGREGSCLPDAVHEIVSKGRDPETILDELPILAALLVRRLIGLLNMKE